MKRLSASVVFNINRHSGTTHLPFPFRVLTTLFVLALPYIPLFNTPCSAAPAPPRGASQSPVVLTVPGLVNYPESGTFCVPILVQDFNGVAGLQFSLTWDPARVQVQQVQSFGLPGLSASNFNLAGAGSGTLACAWFDPMVMGANLPDGAILFEVCFELTASCGLWPFMQFSGTPVAIEAVDGNGNILPVITQDGTMEITGIQQTFYADTDGDGFGNPASTVLACSPPFGYVADNTDCDDTNTAVHPGAAEICNGIDDDCDPATPDPSAPNAGWYPIGTGIDLIDYGTINTHALDAAGNLYVSAYGPIGSTIAKWNGAAWVVLASDIDGSVDALAFDAAGNLYAGGSFTKIGGLNNTQLAKWDGSAWSSLNTNNAAATIGVIAFDASGNLYAGGYFNHIGGVTAKQIAKWNGSAWSALGAGTNSDVTSIVFDAAGDLIAGGYFYYAGGNPANGFAKWNGSSWSDLGANLLPNSSVVYTMAKAPSGDIFAAGSFIYPNGDFAYLIKWDGSAWTTVVDVTDVDANYIAGVGIDGTGNLYAGGNFTAIEGVAASHVAKWNGTTWSALGAGTDGNINKLSFDASGNLFASGYKLTAAGGNPAHGIATWNGSAWSGFDPVEMPGSLSTFEVDAADQLYVGGSFRFVNGVPARNLAVWDGSAWAALGAGIDGYIFELAADNTGNVYVGGEFSEAGGVSAANIAKWNGSAWSALGAGTTGGVRVLTADNAGNVYAGGYFSEAGGIPAHNIAKWNGSAWSALGSGLSDAPNALATNNAGELFAGGNQIGPAGSQRSIRKWNGSTWSALGAGTNNNVRALQTDAAGNLYATGDFTQAGGAPAGRVAKWDGSAWSALGTGLSSSGAALDIDAAGNLYAGGGFTAAGGAPANHIAKWNGSAWAPLSSGVSGFVQKIAIDAGGKVYTGPYLGAPYAHLAYYLLQPLDCAAAPVFPADGAILCGSSITLEWPAVCGATGYDVYFRSDITPPSVSTTAATSFTVNTTGATFYWKIVPKNASGSATACPIWTFSCDDTDGDGYSAAAGDCDDSNAAISPNAIEICNSIDDNCNGQVDEGVTALSVTAAGTNVCPAGTNGAIDITVGSGASPFSFLWSNFSTSEDLSGLPAGTYTVTVSDAGGCTGTVSSTVGVHPAPAAAILGATAICTGQNTSLFASGGSTRVWSTGSTNILIIVAPLVATTYSVTVTDNNGCTGTASATVVVNTPTAAISGTLAVCKDKSTTLTASGGTGYTWSSGAGTAAITVSPAATTTYTVTVTQAAGCTKTASATVTVYPAPTPVITGLTSVCLGSGTTLTATGGVSYAWSTGGNTAAITVSPTVATTYTVTATDANGCTNTRMATVTIKATPQPTIAGTLTICAGKSTTLSVTGGTSRLWSTGATSASIAVAPPVTTTYCVTVTNGSGCTSTASTTVTVYPLPAVTITATALSVCAGFSSTLTASGGASYVWSTGGLSASITVAPLVLTTYTVTATNANGCTSVKSVNIGIKASPQPVILGTSVICAGQNATLSVSGGSSRVWSTGATTTAITITPAATTTYSVTVTNANGCTGTASATVTVNPLPLPYTVTGGGAYCAGGTGVPIGLDDSDVGITYQLKRGTTVAGTQPGNGGAVSFGNFTTSGTYTVIATVTATGCTATMNGSATVVIVSLPGLYNVTGGGSYCAGGAGVPVGLSGSQGFYSYQLYLNGSPVGAPVSGSIFGGSISFGNQTAAGVYTVVASSTLSLPCPRQMNGSQTVTVKPLPLAAIASPGSTCNGTSVMLTASGGGTYLWSTTNTSASITKIPIAPSTTYTVTVTLNGCSSSTSASVAVNLPPTAAVAGANQTICPGVSAFLTGNVPVIGSGAWSVMSGPSTALSQFSDMNSPTATFTPAAGTGNYILRWTITNVPCPASVSNVTITVALPALIGSIANQVVCNGSTTTPVVFNATPAGTTFKWTCSNPAIGLSPSGAGNIPAFTAVNTGTTPQAATVTVTPVLPSVFAYITNYNSNTVSVINTVTNTVVKNINVGNSPIGVSLSPDGSRVYVTNLLSETISVINTLTNTVIATINTAAAPLGIMASPDGNSVYVANSASYSVWGINTATYNTESSNGLTNDPFGIDISPDGTLVYTSWPFLQEIAVFNAASNLHWVGSINVGAQPRGICLSPDGSRAYVANYGTNKVSVINTASYNIEATIVVGSNPYGINISPDGSRVYVSNYGSNTVSVINTATNSVVTTVAVSIHPVGVDVTPDGTRVYVSNEGSNTVSVINTATNSVVAGIDVGAGPKAFGNFLGGPMCTGTPISFNITVNPSPVAHITSILNDPFNFSIKTVFVNASGGTPPYTFERCIPPAPGSVCETGPFGIFTNVPLGSWLFKVIDVNGCTGTLTQLITPLQPTPEDRSKENTLSAATFDFTLYPNPASGENATLFFSGDFEQTNATIRVSDYSGREVFQQRAELRPGDRRELPLRGLPAGVYRVAVWTENGGYRSRAVVVVRH